MSLKHRVARLHAESGAGEAALQAEHLSRRARHRVKALTAFVRAIPAEFEGRVEPLFTDDRITRFVHDGWADRDCPLIVRMSDKHDWRGWHPSPLPSAWVEAVLANPDADADAECTRCGLSHPSGGRTWQDCQPVHLKPHFASCLHCNGEVMLNGWYATHQSYHPFPGVSLGEFILAGGKLDTFDPLRKAT